MNKDDVKAIFLIFIILLLISGVAIFGIKMYKNIMDQNDLQQLYQGNVRVEPDEEENKEPLVVEQGNGVLNQIASAGSQSQTTHPNVSTEKEEYYYKQLDSYAKAIYDKLKDNKENLKSGTYKIDFGKEFSQLLSQENGAELLQDYYQSAMETYLYDNPDVFYLDPTKMYINIQTTKKIFTTTYEVFIDAGSNANYLSEGYNSKQQIIEYENQINHEVEKILEKTTGKSNYEKIQIIHDYLVDNVSYDQTLSKENIYNMYGTLVNKESVCEGYAKAFKYLMNQIGVESIVVIGKATDSNGETQSHAWNYVNFENAWYAIDVTWDDPVLIGGGKLTKKNRYKYFLKGSATMSEDHVASYTFVDGGKVYQHPALSKSDY